MVCHFTPVYSTTPGAAFLDTSTRADDSHCREQRAHYASTEVILGTPLMMMSPCHTNSHSDAPQISWITANAALAVLFGVLHQGGVVPSLFRIHDIVYNDARGIHTHDFQIVYWKTYMPPRHLLAIRQEGTTMCICAHVQYGADHLVILLDVDSRKISVQDLSGASPDMALDALLIFTAFPKLPSTLLVAPFHAVQELGEQVAECLMERDRVFPHLDLDHIGESVQTGWKDGLSLGIFDVDVECLRKTPPYEP